MKAQHTPGPWVASNEPNGDFTVHSERFCVASNNTEELENGMDTNESYANAKLIAAAPTLAARLTDLIQYLGEDWNGDSMVEECKQALADAGVPFEYDDNIIGQP